MILDWVGLGYLFSAIFFVLGLKRLGHPRTAPQGNQLGALGMLVAVLTTVAEMQAMQGIQGAILIVGALLVGGTIGYIVAVKVEMTSMPEMVALFNGFGGLATFFIAWSEFNSVPENTFQYVLIMLTTYIGGVTFSGSIVAYGKLSEKLKIQKTSVITKLFTTVFYVSLAFLLYTILITPSIIPNFEFFTVLLVLTLLGGIGFVSPIVGGYINTY